MAEPTQKERIKANFEKIVTVEVDADLLDYSIDELLSRTMLYLNMTEVPQAFEMVLTNILISQVSTYQRESAGVDTTSTVSKIEDNGQAITYGKQLVNFFATEPDNVVFASATGLLSRYRLAKPLDISKTISSVCIPINPLYGEETYVNPQ